MRLPSDYIIWRVGNLNYLACCDSYRASYTTPVRFLLLHTNKQSSLGNYIYVVLTSPIPQNSPSMGWLNFCSTCVRR